MKFRAFIFLLLCLLAFAMVVLSQIAIHHPKGGFEGAGTSLLIATCGLVIGTLIGLFISPFGPDSKSKSLSPRATALAGFVLGYLTARLLEPIIDSLFTMGGISDDPSAANNVLLALAITFIGVLFGLIYRRFLPVPTERLPRRGPALEEPPRSDRF